MAIFRTAILTALGAASCVALAQDDPARVARLLSAYDQLRNQATLYAQVNATQTVGLTTSMEAAALYFSQEPVGARNVLKAELRTFRGSILVRRVVADGDTFWTYDLVARTYSATPYYVAGRSTPETYRRDFYYLLTANASGSASPLIRLISDVYAGADGPRYRSWMPGVPVADGAILADGLRFAFPAVPTRTVDIDLSPVPDQEGVYQLDRVVTWQTKKSGTKFVTDKSTLVPLNGTTVPSEYNFLPYAGADIAGWHAVAGPKPVSYGG